MTLIGEGNYNLNILKDVEVTDSFLGLDENVRQCQDIEPYDNCTTRHYIENVRKNCGCLPLSINSFEKVKQDLKSKQ